MIQKIKIIANASKEFKIYCGSEFNSPSTTTLVESNLVDMAAFWV